MSNLDPKMSNLEPKMAFNFLNKTHSDNKWWNMTYLRQEVSSKDFDWPDEAEKCLKRPKNVDV